MEFKAILSNIHRHVTLVPEEVAHFVSFLQRTEIRKKEFVLRQGELCSKINFVEKGILRAYYTDSDGDENIIMFAVNDWWITDMRGFVRREPSMVSIQALEDAVIVELAKSDLDRLFVDNPKFERFFRILMENAYIREQTRVLENLSLPAQDRYENFLKKYPQFAKQVPLKQIASYLGITPEFLSVLRKKPIS